MKRSSCCMALVLILLVSMTGCDKVSPATISVVKTVSATARERAVSFDIIKNLITAKNPADQVTIDKFLVDHGSGLQAEAKGFDDLSKALDASSTIEKATKVQLVNAADTAKTRALIFSKMSAYLSAKGGQATDQAQLQAFISAHQTALNSIADMTAQIAASFNKDKTPDATAPPAAPSPAPTIIP